MCYKNRTFLFVTNRLSLKFSKVKPNNDGINSDESSSAIYRALLSPVRAFQDFPWYKIWYGWIFQFQIWNSTIRKKPKSRKPRSHEIILESNWILPGGRGMGCREWLIGLLYRVLTQWSVKTAKCLSDSEFIENYWSWSAPIRHLPFTIFKKLPAQFW